jgi:ribosomal protein S18 acetylase RimI-like enzyme
VTIVSLRKATQEDAETLGALHVVSWQETYPGILPEGMLASLTVDDRIAMWRRILTTPDDFGCAVVIVAETGGSAIGFGACGKQRDQDLIDAGFSGEFGAIYVLRSHQRRGVGRSLMVSLSKELSAAGHKAASLWVLRGNDPARAFYDRMGGLIVGERIDEMLGATLTEDAYGWRDLSPLVG